MHNPIATSTIRQDAIDFVTTISNAPDIQTHSNLIDELRERYVAQATVLQALAESNERWAKESKAKREAVEKFIDTYVEYGDEPNASVSDLAEAFDIDLDREWSGYITVTYRITGTAKRGLSDEEISGLIDITHEPNFDGVTDTVEVSDSWFEEVLTTHISTN
jgi:hypothetical protein